LSVSMPRRAFTIFINSRLSINFSCLLLQKYKKIEDKVETVKKEIKNNKKIS